MLAGFGAIVLMTASLPPLLKELPLSLPIICVAFGLVLFLLDAAGASIGQGRDEGRLGSCIDIS